MVAQCLKNPDVNTAPFPSPWSPGTVLSLRATPPPWGTPTAWGVPSRSLCRQGWGTPGFWVTGLCCGAFPTLGVEQTRCKAQSDVVLHIPALRTWRKPSLVKP